MPQDQWLTLAQHYLQMITLYAVDFRRHDEPCHTRLMMSVGASRVHMYMAWILHIRLSRFILSIVAIHSSGLSMHHIYAHICGYTAPFFTPLPLCNISCSLPIPIPISSEHSTYPVCRGFPPPRPRPRPDMPLPDNQSPEPFLYVLTYMFLPFPTFPVFWRF